VPDVTYDVEHDNLDRLTDLDYLVGVLTEDEQFTYDDLGNRTNVNLRSGSNESYSVNSTTNRYNSVGGNSITYDDAGNMTIDKDGCTYEYDYEDRLIKVEDGQQNDVVEYMVLIRFLGDQSKWNRNHVLAIR